MLRELGLPPPPPVGMSIESWNKTVQFFTLKKHVNRSTQNKVNRAKQVIKNPGGTSSYNSVFVTKRRRVQAFHDAHVNQDGQFDNPTIEEHYCVSLLNKLNSQPTLVDEPTVFEKVFDTHRGHIKGIGHKPSARTSSSPYFEGHSHASPHTHAQPEC
ncbi:hypothetical protein OSB04_012666 [Centaurea solstitialis]|uniref:Uncharacterized protein n=1 Tax=Centaurea solstitialis TaxID=347529 RepID=A0AA38WE73_9ASTR|nr:hypothetical protein OSB04_012666 [Centaurea solstitialis]